MLWGFFWADSTHSTDVTLRLNNLLYFSRIFYFAFIIQDAEFWMIIIHHIIININIILIYKWSQPSLNWNPGWCWHQHIFFVLGPTSSTPVLSSFKFKKLLLNILFIIKGQVEVKSPLVQPSCSVVCHPHKHTLWCHQVASCNGRITMNWGNSYSS